MRTNDLAGNARIAAAGVTAILIDALVSEAPVIIFVMSVIPLLLFFVIVLIIILWSQESMENVTF